MALATAARRTAGAAAALSSQTSRNAKTAKETADAVYSAAQAEAEKLERLAVQAQKDYDLSVGDDTDANAAATVGIQTLEDEALGEDTKLTGITSTYTTARDTYQNSTKLIVVLTSKLATAAAATATAQGVHDKASAAADVAKKAADDAHIKAKTGNDSSKADDKVGEETTEEAIDRAKGVAADSTAAQTAEIKAAELKMVAADKLDLLNSARLFQKTAQETLDAENARNKVLAFESNQTEQNMIEQSHVTALAKTAAADAKATSETAYFESSSSKADMKDRSDKAQVQNANTIICALNPKP